MPLYTYLRVSTDAQDHEAQRAALTSAGVEADREFIDVLSGKTTSRPGLDEMLATVRWGDTVVVYRLDRLGRSMLHLVSLVLDLEQRGVTVRSISESLDTSTTMGKMVLSLYAGMAQLERETIAMRTKAGLAAAKARGVRLGSRGAEQRTRSAAGVKVQTEQRRAHAEALRWVLEPLEGRPHAEVARLLNERGIPTAAGGKWRHQAVRNVRERLARMEA
jgi:DNA invertase Pin-like site-specific DNA recombinase